MPDAAMWTDPDLVAVALSELDDGLWISYKDTPITSPYLMFVFTHPDRPRGLAAVELPYTEKEVLRVAGPEPVGQIERFVALLGANMRQLSPGKMRDELVPMSQPGEDLVAVAAYMDSWSDVEQWYSPEEFAQLPANVSERPLRQPGRALIAADGYGNAYQFLRTESKEITEVMRRAPTTWPCVPDLERIGAFQDGEAHGHLLWGLAALAQTYREVFPPGGM